MQLTRKRITTRRLLTTLRQLLLPSFSHAYPPPDKSCGEGHQQHRHKHQHKTAPATATES